jgi:hypothetical protein
MPAQKHDITLSGINNTKQLDEKIAALHAAVHLREMHLNESLPKLPGEALKSGLIAGTDLFLLTKISVKGTGIVSNLLSLLLKSKEKNEALDTKEKLKSDAKQLSFFSGLKVAFNMFKYNLSKKPIKADTVDTGTQKIA